MSEGHFEGHTRGVYTGANILIYIKRDLYRGIRAIHILVSDILKHSRDTGAILYK